MEEKVIEQLFKEHYLDMYKLARSLLYDPEESKDVVSDIFASLVNTEMVIVPETIRQYLMMSVKNRCFNIIKQKSPRDRIIHLYALEHESHPVMEHEGEERKQRLHDFIHHQLSTQDQELFRMRFIEEMSYKEMMKATGISRMAIYKHLSRTINLIKEHFNPNDK